MTLAVRVVAAVFLAHAAGGGDGAPLPDPKPFFDAVRTNLAKSQDEQKLFAYRERRTDLDLNPFGRLGTTGTRVIEVIPLPEGTALTRRVLERDGKPVPGLDSADFKGAVTVLNVWASWCVPCRDEAPLLLALAADRRIRVVGINYKDQPDNARRFLGRYGNPFAAAGADGNGRASMDWGVYGVPETFLIGRDGKIAYKLVGPITEANLARVLKPEIEKALATQ